MDALDNSQAPLLVTTALEDTWGTNESLVFLGEWCRLYDRKDVWAQRPHSVIRNHWDDRKKLRKDHDYLKGLHDALLADLARAMNRHHGIERPLRYWQTILDPWLLTYVAVIWDRWESVRIAFDDHSRFETFAIESSAESTCFRDYNDFIEKILHDPWNQHLFLDIISSHYPDRCVIRRVATNASINRTPTPSVRPKKRSIKFRMAAFADSVLGRLSPRNRAVIFDAYFPPFALLRLQLRLEQVPRLYLNEFDPPILAPGSSGSDGLSLRRNRNSISLGFAPNTPFETFLLGRIVSDIPSAYVENFPLLRLAAGRIAMKPKVILTANAHWGNELFKLWTAEQVFCGAKFVSMEHGGSIFPAFSSMSFEEDIADVKITWAVPFHQKHTRLPACKLANFKINSASKHLAIVGYEMPRYNFRAEASPKAGQMLTQHELVCELYSFLSEAPKASFLVKPYPGKGWNTRQRFIDKLGADKVSEEPDFFRFLSDARVVVCTYPQTTFSEAMASGLPSILFYPAHLWETISEFDSLLESLRSANIVFHDPKAAADHINRIWENPDQWWRSPDVVKARIEFHRQALALDGNWLEQWTNFISEMAERA